MTADCSISVVNLGTVQQNRQQDLVRSESGSSIALKSLARRMGDTRAPSILQDENSKYYNNYAFEGWGEQRSDVEKGQGGGGVKTGGEHNGYFVQGPQAIVHPDSGPRSRTSLGTVKTDECFVREEEEEEEEEGEAEGKEQAGDDPAGCLSCAARLAMSVRQVALWALVAFGVWCLIYIWWGKKEAFSGGTLMTMLVLEVVAVCFGKTLEAVNAPPMLGMFAAGLLLRNVDFGFVQFNFTHSSTLNPIRGSSVVVLITKGVLSLNPKLLRKHWKICMLVITFPCIFDAVASAIAFHLIVQLPVEWAGILASFTSAMSGILVSQYMGILAPTLANGNKEVVEIIKAACGLDIVYAITMTKVIQGYAFNGDLITGVSTGLLEILVGVSSGILWGTLLGVLMTRQNGVELRTICLAGGGMISMLGTGSVGYHGGGPLGVFTGSLIATSIWRDKKIGGENNNDVQKNHEILWLFFQPVLFSYIGSRIDLYTLDWSMFAGALVCMAIGYVVRVLTVLAASTVSSDLGWSQRALLAVSWLPKGTLQAALGPVPLELAVEFKRSAEFQAYCATIQNLAAMYVVVGSTLSWLSFMTVGRWLARKPTR